MSIRSVARMAVRTGIAVAAVVMLIAARFAATTVVYSFAGDEDGEYPDTDLVMDAAGNLYGTTVSGGDFGGGTVFKLSPSGSGWTHTVLYDFTGQTDGGEPYGGVTLDAAGNLYGTAVVGGTGLACEQGCGVLYQLSNSGGTWTEHVLHNFTGGADGSGPGSGVTIDAGGSIYGMTPTGGADALGVIFQVSPNGSGWSFHVIHTFTGGADGATGSKGRLLLRSGSLFGVATAGGTNQSGVAFQLTRSGSKWNLHPIYEFQGTPDAGFPYGALSPDAAGNLYGTTYYDGAHNLGCVYRLHRLPSGQWVESVLHSFTGGADGNGPISNLVFDAAGNLYGTTSEGGTTGLGTIFELAARTWQETVVHTFTGSPDGEAPYDGMVSNGAGTYYGATVRGGVANEGAIYSFTP